MYIFMNAIKNLGRNKGRNMLMAVIIFSIIVTTVVCITINTTTNSIIDDYKSRFGSEVTLTFNEKMANLPMDEFKEATTKQQLEYGKSDLLQKKVINLKVMFSTELKALDEETSLGQELEPIRDTGNIVQSALPAKGLIIGSSEKNISEEFKKGTRKIIKGKLFKNKNEVIISEKFAKLNNLSVGDTIKVTSIIEEKPMAEQLKVTGIYVDKSIPDPTLSQIKKPVTNRDNEILTSLETAASMEMSDETGIVESRFFLKNPSLLPAFEKELREKGLPEFYDVSTDEAGYKQVIGPIEGLANISNLFLKVVFVLGSALLILLSTLSIRERKYEIGVLRAMGMKKGKLALGLLSETLVVTMVCLVLGLGIGSVASQPIANGLLQNQVGQPQESSNMDQVISGEDNSDLEPLSELSVLLSADAIGQIVLISLILACISSLVGILFITRFEPRKILSERN
ncbi:ABC transporter permease [Bacillus sp. 1P06AnD]|uniref:ABC transporter permease n=1 Tax=Bacillus sp. 1P06AnD TaxID=3132208 RepID=UPI00399FFC38